MKDIDQILAEQGGSRQDTITKDGKWDVIFIAQMLANMVTSGNRDVVKSDFEKLNNKMALLSADYAEELATDFQTVLQSYKEQREAENEAEAG